MESAQKEVLRVLLNRLADRGLICQDVCANAIDLVSSTLDLPELLQYPGRLTKEEVADEYPQNPQ